LPFARITLKALIEKEAERPPQSLGEHIRRRRRELGISQRQATKDLGVNDWTVLNWEKGRTAPPIGAIPAILLWLGHDPFPRPRTLQERMLAARRAAGWTIGEAARQLGVNAATWGDWERTGRVPWRHYQRRLEEFLDDVLKMVS